MFPLNFILNLRFLYMTADSGCSLVNYHTQKLGANKLIVLDSINILAIQNFIKILLTYTSKMPRGTLLWYSLSVSQNR